MYLPYHFHTIASLDENWKFQRRTRGMLQEINHRSRILILFINSQLPNKEPDIEKAETETKINYLNFNLFL